MSDSQFLKDAIEGLGSKPKHLSAKYFYDARGSELFDKITETDEYYVTQIENDILRDNAGTIADSLGAGCALIELGSGSSHKIRHLLDRMENPMIYVPVDISAAPLTQAAEEFRQAYSHLPVVPVHADYGGKWELPEEARSCHHKIAFFPGSTIGNLDPADARAFLRTLRSILGVDGKLLTGIDLIKSKATLEAAYNDRDGITAQFNLNILRRMNSELGANFDLSAFRHRAFFNADRSRMEMHLESLGRQTVHLGNRSFDFEPGETIHTESSYKYTPEAIGQLAADSGYDLRRTWMDEGERFAVALFEVGTEPAAWAA